MPTPNVALLLEPGYWFNGNPGPPTPYTYVLIGLFALVLVVSLAVWLRRRQLFPGQRIKTRLASQLGPWFVAFAGAGLFFLLLRLIEFPILSSRILWLACGVALVVLAGYVGWYFVRRYRVEIARLEREELRQRYMPRPRRRASKRRR